ncbi:hypothetical protein PSHT_10478 [Puccinia striiformis]|uniref:Uncharacterized protein n=2 Tax=Puccinia striiformis TaxID=27350 RepID=A0A2S4V9E2_9BASI|nr:hypothetical protein PSTT_13118 [Puccinia striiformis]POW06162.1 hypothetical protein PSHT_10478 [Puccinia striiformis]
MTWTVGVLVLSLLITDRTAWAAGNKKSKSGTCLDPSVIQSNAKSNGIKDPANPDKNAKSLISSNNFVRHSFWSFKLFETFSSAANPSLFFPQIDFCLGATITNGAQLDAGSCNPTPMGSIPSKEHMPSVRIIGPSPDDVIPPNTTFDVDIFAHKIELGYFTSPANTYYLAPQQLNKNGLIKGHSHITIERVDGNRIFDTANPVFFKGVAGRAVNGQVKTSIKDGLPAGLCESTLAYLICTRANIRFIPSFKLESPSSSDRISTITSAMNHQPVVLPVARRGAVDDAIYVRVGTGKKGGSASKSSGTSDNSSTGTKSKTGEKTKSKKHKNKKVGNFRHFSTIRPNP